MNAAHRISAPSLSERTLDLDSDDILFNDDDPAPNIFRVVSGNLFLFKSLPDNRRQILRILSPGQYFGFPVEGRRGCSAQCLSAARVREIGLDRLDGGALGSLTEGLRSELSDAYERITWLGRKTARERLASFLLSMADSRLDTPLKTAFVADLLGLRLETVSRLLHQMRRDGVILQANLTDRPHILDRLALKRLADGHPAKAAEPQSSRNH